MASMKIDNMMCQLCSAMLMHKLLPGMHMAPSLAKLALWPRSPCVERWRLWGGTQHGREGSAQVGCSST